MNFLVIRTSDDLVVNVIVADGVVDAATPELRLVEGVGDLASTGIGWTVTVDGTATPPAAWTEIEEPVDEPSPPEPAA